MVVLGSVTDPDEGAAIALGGPRVRFAIELPGSRGSAALQLPPMLPVRWVVFSAATFCASAHSLRNGLSDATAADARAAQLQRVCGALAELRAAGTVEAKGVGGGSVDLTGHIDSAVSGGPTAPECFQVRCLTIL